MRVSWSMQEIEILRRSYSTKGLDWCAQYLQRSKKSVQRKASTLGIAGTYKTWSSKEEEFLQKYYPDNGYRFCAKALDRTEGSVRNHVKQLGLTRKGRYPAWRKEESELLYNHYEKDGFSYCKNALQRTTGAIQSKALSFGLRTKSKKWLPEEIKYLRKNCNKDLACCAKELGRSKSSVKSKLYRMRKKDSKEKG